MASPSRLHYWLAAGFMTLIIAVSALGVTRFIEHRSEVKLSLFKAISAGMELALKVESRINQAKGKPSMAKAVAPETPAFLAAQEMLENGQANRVLIVEKGRKIESLGVSRPAKVLLDYPNPVEAGDPTTEQVLALAAKLDHHFDTNPGDPSATKVHEVSWATQRDNQTLVVAAWPVIVQGKLVGLAAVEQAPTHVGKLLLLPALLLLAACLILTALALWKTTVDRRLALALPGIVIIAGAVVMLVNHQRSVADESLLQRDLAATRVLNTAEWTRPDAIAQLDHKWDEIFGQETPAELTRLPNGAAVVAAPTSAATSEALSLALPVALVALSLLALAVLGLKGTAGIVWGLAKMPGVYGYVAPAMVGMLVLVLVPFLMGVALAFFNQDYDFVGLQNFQTILFPSGTSDTNFYFTLGVTVLWTVSNIFLHVAIGLFMALILVNPKVRFKGLFRVLLIVPWAVPNYITALIWRWMFTSKIGAINRILESIGIQGPDWFGQSFWANFGANLATNVWLGFPFMMVVAMGALQSIPAELYEAADVDGASRWQKFRNITLPLLKPALFPAIILGTIWTFNMFNVIYLVSRGGPDNQTNILITEAYRFFKELNQYGIAAAYCILIFVILMLYTLVTNKVTKATKGAFE